MPTPTLARVTEDMKLFISRIRYAASFIFRLLDYQLYVTTPILARVTEGVVPFVSKIRYATRILIFILFSISRREFNCKKKKKDKEEVVINREQSNACVCVWGPLAALSPAPVRSWLGPAVTDAHRCRSSHRPRHRVHATWN